MANPHSSPQNNLLPAVRLSQLLHIEGRSQSPCPFPAQEGEGGAGRQRAGDGIDREADNPLIVPGIHKFP